MLALIDGSWFGKISIVCCLTHLNSFMQPDVISDTNFGLITKLLFNQNSFTFTLSTLNRAFQWRVADSITVNKRARLSY